MPRTRPNRRRNHARPDVRNPKSKHNPKLFPPSLTTCRAHQLSISPPSVSCTSIAFSRNQCPTLSPPYHPRVSLSRLSTPTHHTIMLDINYYSAGCDHSVSNRSCSPWAFSSPFPCLRSSLFLHHHCNTGPHPFTVFYPQTQSLVWTSLAIVLLLTVLVRFCVYMHMCMCLSLSVLLFSLLVVEQRN